MQHTTHVRTLVAPHLRTAQASKPRRPLRVRHPRRLGTSPWAPPDGPGPACPIMRRHARKVEVSGTLLDTCGTGGLPWKSLNTSTASAIVIAAAGGRVAKHGNRSVPPKTGSADVLEALGVNLEIDEDW